MKTYVLLISKKYPSYHCQRGNETYFTELIEAGVKIHTIRSNYELWQKRIKEVYAGKAILSLRYWEGLPYDSKQIEIKQITKADKPGVQKIFLTKSRDEIFKVSIDGIEQCLNDERGLVARNDGLRLLYFANWFFPKESDLEYTGAIIHFTKFRYNYENDNK